MTISKKIKSLLAESGIKQYELLEILNIGSSQAMSNKFTNERWSAEDLSKIADYCGCKLAFILPSGERIVINDGGNREKGSSAP